MTGFVGHRLGSIQSPHDMVLSAGDSLRVLLNLGCVSTAVGSLACLISACSDRRGKAIGIVFAVLVASFLLNFLAQFQDWAKSISWLSVMEYYRPAIIIQTHELPWKDLAVLAGIFRGVLDRWIACVQGTKYLHRVAESRKRKAESGKPI